MEKIGPAGERFAVNLRRQRILRELTLRDLAARLADIERPIQLTALSKIERGQRRVDIDDLMALATALQVSPSVLLEPDSSERPEHFPAKEELSVLAQHRTILAIDIDGSTSRTNSVRAQLRTLLYEVLDEAFAAGGISRKYRDPFVDRGDGALCLVRPADSVPKALVLSQVVPALADLLTELAETRPELAFRARVAVHAGEVNQDGRGPYGEDIDIACRLVDAPELKRRLHESENPIALVVSHEIHRSVVRHGYRGIAQESFVPAVHVKVGEARLRGWVYTPETASGQ